MTKESQKHTGEPWRGPGQGLGIVAAPTPKVGIHGSYALECGDAEVTQGLRRGPGWAMRSPSSSTGGARGAQALRAAGSSALSNW